MKFPTLVLDNAGKLHLVKFNYIGHHSHEKELTSYTASPLQKDMLPHINIVQMNVFHNNYLLDDEGRLYAFDNDQYVLYERGLSKKSKKSGTDWRTENVIEQYLFKIEVSKMAKFA